VLLHDASPAGTPKTAPAIIDALPEVLAGLTARGLRAVTVSELLGEPAYFADRDTPPVMKVPGRGFLARAVAVTFALLFLAAGASAFAASNEPRSGVKETSVEDLPASFVAAAEILAGHSSVSARFIQTKRSQLFVDEVVQRGLLRLRTQDRRLLWSYDGGAQLLLAEGQFYSLSARGPSTAGRRLPPMASRMAEMMESLFFMRLEVIKEHFYVSDEDQGWFLLRARRTGPQAPFKEVRLQIGGEPLALHRVVLEEKGGDVTRIELTELELGSLLPPELFRLPGDEVKAP
jgi:outer membrane lipoprotein-sorting protein